MRFPRATHLVAFLDNHVILEVNNSDVVAVTDAKLIIKDTRYYQDLTRYFVQVLDIDSPKGRSALLRNILPESSDMVPLKQKTEKLNLTFKRRGTEYEFKLVDLRRVVGTLHPDYVGYSWLDIYFYLKRPSQIMNAILKPQYYELLSRKGKYDDPIELYEIDNKTYFVDSGNHRTTLAKLMGRSHVCGRVSDYYTDYVYEQAFNDLVDFGFNVTFRNRYTFQSARAGLEYDWEIFEFTVEDFQVTLLGINAILTFIEEYKALSLSQIDIEIQRAKNIFRGYKKSSLIQKNYKMFLAHKRSMLAQTIA